MISAETDQARIASPRDAVACHVIGPHFRDYEYAVALTGNDAADQFLRPAIAVNLRRVDQPHPERKAGAQRFFLSGLRMSSLREICRALTERRDNCPIGELYRGGRCTSRRTWQRHHHCADRRERRAKRRPKSIEFAPVQQLLVHTSLSDCYHDANCSANCIKNYPAVSARPQLVGGHCPASDRKARSTRTAPTTAQSAPSRPETLPAASSWRALKPRHRQCQLLHSPKTMRTSPPRQTYTTIIAAGSCRASLVQNAGGQ